MLQSKTFTMLAGFLITWAAVCFAFPLIPGISFDNGAANAFWLALGQFVVTGVVVILALIAFIIFGFIYVLRHDTKIRVSDITRWSLRQGYWKFTIGGFVLSMAFSTAMWELTSVFSKTLSFDGFLPVLTAAFVIYVGNTAVKLVTNPKSLMPSGFRQTLELELAKQAADEEKKGE
jgi:hypothetical protein